MTERDPKWLLWFDRNPWAVPLMYAVSILCWTFIVVAVLLHMMNRCGSIAP